LVDIRSSLLRAAEGDVSQRFGTGGEIDVVQLVVAMLEFCIGPLVILWHSRNHPQLRRWGS
jgi:hypothetical protein